MTTILKDIRKGTFVTLLIRNEKDEVLVCMHSSTNQLTLPSVSLRKKEITNPGLVKKHFLDEIDLHLDTYIDLQMVLRYKRVTNDHVSDVHNALWNVSWNERCRLPKTSGKRPLRWATWLSADDLVEMATCELSRKKISHALMKVIQTGNL